MNYHFFFISTCTLFPSLFTLVGVHKGLKWPRAFQIICTFLVEIKQNWKSGWRCKWNHFCLNYLLRTNGIQTWLWQRECFKIFIRTFCCLITNVLNIHVQLVSVFHQLDIMDTKNPIQKQFPMHVPMSFLTKQTLQICYYTNVVHTWLGPSNVPKLN